MFYYLFRRREMFLVKVLGFAVRMGALVVDLKMLVERIWSREGESMCYIFDLCVTRSILSYLTSLWSPTFLEFYGRHILGGQ